MTRRLRIAGTALGAFLVPACACCPPETATLRTDSPPTPDAPAATTPAPTTTGKVSRNTVKFGEGRPDADTAVAQAPTPTPSQATPPAPAAPKPAAGPAPAIVSVPPAGLAPVEHKAPAPAPVEAPRPTAAAEKPKPIGETSKPLAAKPIDKPKVPDPIPDAEGVVRPHWPVIKGARPMAEPAGPTDLVPPSDLIPKPNPDEPPAALAPLPGGTPLGTPIGSTLHKVDASPVPGAVDVPATPALPPPSFLAPAADAPPATGGETPLVQAIRAFQQNKPDEAVELLKAYDPATQQVFLSLMPALVRMSEQRLQAMKPAEVDAMLEQLTRVPNMLRQKASLQANNVRLCREVHNFAHVEPFPDRHQFKPEDVCYLYMEMANFSCVADTQNGGYVVTLTTAMELKDGAGNVVWKADPKDIPDRVSTPPQDYYRNFRLCVPAVPPGAYTLTVKMTDRPTGREVQKAVELRVGAK